MIASLRQAVEADVDAIAATIRPADAREMKALGTTPEKAMREGLQRSDWTLTGLLDGVPVCMFGVAPLNILLGHGAPWMLASETLDRMDFETIRREFLPLCHRGVQIMREDYPVLLNLVDTRNTKAIRWLRLLGFKFGKNLLHHNGQAFHVFLMGNVHV